MIRFVDSESLGSELMRLTASGGAAACRIGSLFLSYGKYDEIARFWVGFDGDEPYCAVSLFGGCATVLVRKGHDLSELRDFLRLLSPLSVAAEADIFPEAQRRETLSVMRLVSPAAAVRPARVLSGYCDIPCREIYELLQLCRCEDIIPPPYEDFVSALTGFQKRGTPFCSITEDRGTITSFAMTQAVTDSAAIIGSVCTLPDMRGQGLGGAAVLSLSAALGDREIFVICDRERNGGFYKKMGFEELGVWS